MSQDRRLDTQVVGHDPPVATRGRHRVGGFTGNAGDHVDAVGPGLGRCRSGQRGLVGCSERPGHGTFIAQVAGEAPGVDAGNAGNTVGNEHGVQVTAGPPVAVAPGQVPHDHPATEGSAALVVLVVDPVVADVGIRERDDLTRIGRIGNDLLVAGQDRVEHDLAGRHTIGRRRADRLALKDRTVGQDQVCLDGEDSTQPRASPSTTTGSPAERVCLTRPLRVRPSYGVLELGLAMARPETVHVSSRSITQRLAWLPATTGVP